RRCREAPDPDPFRIQMGQPCLDIRSGDDGTSARLSARIHRRPLIEGVALMRAAKRLQTIHVKDNQGRIVSSWQRVRVPVPYGISASLPPPYTGLKHLTKKVQTEAEYAETKARFLTVIAGAGEWDTIHRELSDLNGLSLDEIMRRGPASYRLFARLEQKQDEI